ncbi:transmembrane anchor protein [Bosea beijingensis]|uniref:transmembrane anchor protein n=1 Tax=Bosea beijingensis TaxID=3068632 RepID=UPI002742449F|nr:transmembrane anchor protein [Bosea sp. REN20]
MYNTDIPTRAELPTTKQLLRSTAIALVSAAGILVTIVLPAEYAIDPTGIGRALQLTEMGEIKTQLALEAEADRARDNQAPSGPAETVPVAPAPDKRSSLLTYVLANLLVTPAHAQGTGRSDETVITLKPNEGAEYKLTMKAGAKVSFSWTTENGNVNYDMHGIPAGGGKEKSYKQGRGVPGDEGVLTAESDGGHGWFFRNRGRADVTIKLKTTGAYTEIKRMS